MANYLVTVELDMDHIGEFEDVEFFISNAPSAFEADRFAISHCRFMGFTTGGTVGTTHRVETCSPGATALTYRTRY